MVDMYMETFTGQCFFPDDPHPDMIRLEDIAHALSLQCRYGGHCMRFYSVAEHCFLLANHVVHKRLNPEIAMVALMHDAAEAYLMDLPRAIKTEVGEAYKNLEAKVEAVIWEKFGIVDIVKKWHGIVKELDGRIIVNEREALMRPSNNKWFNSPENGFEPIYVPSSHRLGVRPEQAEVAFIKAFQLIGRSIAAQNEENARGSQES